MPESKPLPSPARLVAWWSAVLAAPLAVLALRAVPGASLIDAPWLSVAIHALLAVAAAAAMARWLLAALGADDPRGGLLAAGLGMLAAGAAAAMLAALPPPAVTVALGLAGGGLTWAVAAWLDGGRRLAAAVIASGVFAASVAALAAALFVPWPESVGPAMAGLATALLAAAALVGTTRRTVPMASLALLLGGAAALTIARAQSVEGAVAIVPLVAACGRLAVEHIGTRATPDVAHAAEPGPALPALVHDLAEGVLLLDRDGRLLDWNVAATTLLDLGPQPRGRWMAEILVPSIGQAAWNALALTASRSGSRVVTERGRPLELTAAAGDGDAIILVVRDLSLERNEATEASRLARELRGTIEELLDARRTVDLQRAELERASLIDAPTGVASRRAFLDRLRTEVAQGRRYSHPLALVVIDVDDFAALNRDHGLAVGDTVLRELALRLRLRIREADALGRLGGDCFAAILPHTDERGAAVFADAVLRRMVTRPVLTDEGQLSVTISLGVALMRPGMDIDDEALLAAADEALASARRGGGNRIAFDRRHGLVRLDERYPIPRPPVADEPSDAGGA